jgi:hypothetical protein
MAWGSSFTPTITQTSTTAATGAPMTVSAQSSTGTGATGGALNLSSGNGATLGNINFQSGNGAYTLTTMSGQTGAWTWGATALASLGYTSTTGALGNNFTISPQASTATNGTPGNVVVNIPAPTGTGTEGQFQLLRGSATIPNFQVGQKTGNSNVTGLYLNNGTAGLGAPNASNYSMEVDYGGNLQLNAPFSGASIFFNIINSTTPLTVSAAAVKAAAPILGDSTQSSPYGVHGDVTTAITTTTTLSAAQYSMFIIPVAPTAAMTLTLPRAAAGSGFSKLFDVQAAFAVTITDGTHSVTLPAAIGTYEVAFTNAKLMGGTTKL